MRKRLGMFFILLLLTLTMSFGTPVFAGGESESVRTASDKYSGGGSGNGGGSSGGSGSGYVSSQPVYWELPPITKRILLPDGKTKFQGNIKFDIKVTLLIYSPQGPQPLKSMAKQNTFSIDFSSNEMGNGNSVEKSYEIDTLVRGMVSKLEQQPPQPGGDGGNGWPGMPYSGILVEVSESESSTPGLSLVMPEKNLVTMSIDLIPGGSQPQPRPKALAPSGTVPPQLEGRVHRNGPVLYGNTRFVNRYTPDKPNEPDCPNVCPNPNQGNCKQNSCDTPCRSGCPDINININNENNSSANNNNVNNNTNVGRDQYNVNQNANPNPNLKLDRYNHFAYVHGYPDRSFRPEGTITRGEMTAIFRRLLDQGTFIGSNSTAFRDVRSGDWYASDVDRLSTLGVISGYPDGSFRPNASVTRAEFASVAAKFVSAKSGQGFSDLNGHWAQNAIEKLNSAGWVSGYGDGSFRPDSVITRAEVVSIVNRMLDRQADAGYVQNHRGSLIQYTDLAPNHWAYLPIMEASNAHDYTRNSDGSETWTRHWR